MVTLATALCAHVAQVLRSELASTFAAAPSGANADPGVGQVGTSLSTSIPPADVGSVRPSIVRNASALQLGHVLPTRMVPPSTLSPPSFTPQSQ